MVFDLNDDSVSDTEETHLPTSSDAHLPTSSDAHLPTSSEVHLSTCSEVHLSTCSDSHIPTSANDAKITPEMTSEELDDEKLHRQRARLTEWDKLTLPWFTNGHLAPEATPYSSLRKPPRSPPPRAIAKKKMKSVRSNYGPVTGAAATANARARRMVSRRPAVAVWEAGMLCEAKFQAQNVGGALARWFPGTVESVSADGSQCDVRFDDGDYEAAVPRKYMRLPKTSATSMMVESPCESEDRSMPSWSTRSVDVAAVVTKLVVPSLTPPMVCNAPTDESFPQAAVAAAPAPAFPLRARMIELLKADVLVLSDIQCVGVVDACGDDRKRFRSVRFNLKNNTRVAQALARGEISLESVTNLSAFSEIKESRQALFDHATEPADVLHRYVYRNGQYLPRCDELVGK